MRYIKIALIILVILFLGFIFIFLEKKEVRNKISEEFMKKEIKSEIQKEILEKISITTVYDNYSVNSRLQTNHGFSTLITLDNQNILFDTGADPDVLLSNMEKMEINPEKIDFIFISHLHGDHTGGLAGILKIEPDLKVYKPEFFSGPKEIVNGVWTTGPLGVEIKEQSLIISSEKGLAIITGCAHPGVVNIIKKAKEMFPSQTVNLVLGGFHLSGASDFELQSIIGDFRKLGVQKVAPCHCSGDRTREFFKEEYKDDFIENGVGEKIILKFL